MKICLINPPWNIRKDNIWSHIRPAYPHLGLLDLAAVLEREGIDADIVDFPALLLDWRGIEEKIRTLHYDYFGITATTSVAHNGYRVSEIIKKFSAGSKVIFGGVHATSLPEEPLQKGMADFVIRGDGEEALVKLLKGSPVSNIAGLSYKDTGAIRHVQPNGFVEDLDDLPFPAYHKIDMKLYKPTPGSYKRLPAINLITSRGCPGKCTFCNSAHVQLRRRSAENIFEDIAILVRKYGIKELSFYDDTFTVYPGTVMRLCELLMKNKIRITWSCFARTDCVNTAMLKAMKAAGCHQIMYGIESANEKILESIRKNVNLEKTAKAVRMTKDAGISVRCTFMFGNPGETRETIDETIAYSIALDPDIALYNITTPYPGTEMFEWARENGTLITQDWDRYDLGEPVMNLPTIDNETLKKKYKEAFRRFYLRPKCIVRQLVSMNLPYLFRGARALGNFFIRSRRPQS